MKNYFKLTKLVVCLFAITIFSSCNSNDVKRGFIGRIVDLNCNKKDSVVSIVKEVGQSSLAEHRVYYFDNSRSMIYTGNMINGRTLLDVLKDSLYQTVDALPIGTIVEVIVFSDYAWWQKSQENASDYFPMADQMCSLHIENKMTDKTKMLNFIKNISAIGKLSETVHYDTHHSIAINDFLTRRQLNGYVNTMYLLTDGDDEYNKPRGRSANIESGKSVLKSRWSVSRNMHCIYVALNEMEYNLGRYFRQQNENRHLYHVRGCNTRINLFSIDDSIHIDNALLPHNICFKTNGESPKNITISHSDKYYQCTLTSFNPIAKEVKLRVEPKKDTTLLLPQMHDMKIVLNLEWENDSNRINLPRKSLPLIIRCRIPQNGVMSIATPIQMGNAKIKFRKDKVFWNENNPDTLIYKVNYKFSENLTNRLTALQSPYLSIDFGDANDYIELLDTHGVLQSRIKLPIASDTTISFALTIDKNHDNLQRRQTLHGKIALNNLTNVDALYLGKNPIEKCNGSYVIYDDFELEIKQRWELWKWCLLTAIILVIIIIFLFKLQGWCAPKFSRQKNIYFDVPHGIDNIRLSVTLYNGDIQLVDMDATSIIRTSNLCDKYIKKIIVTSPSVQEKTVGFLRKKWSGDMVYIKANNLPNGITQLSIKPEKEDCVSIEMYSEPNYKIEDENKNANVVTIKNNQSSWKMFVAYEQVKLPTNQYKN